MILTAPGILSTAQDLTAGNAVSENVIDMAALGIQGFGPGNNNLWLDVECETAEGSSSGSSSTYVIKLALDDTEAATSPVYYVLEVHMAHSDPRIAVAGRKIFTGMLPDQIWQLAKDGYRYLALYCVLADGNGTAAMSINAAISPSMPETQRNTQTTRSNVTVPS
jgi:hypothetical protein